MNKVAPLKITPPVQIRSFSRYGVCHLNMTTGPESSRNVRLSLAILKKTPLKSLLFQLKLQVMRHDLSFPEK